MRDMTLVFLQRDDEVLLAMKKRGFGEGRWNGVGGKVDPDETIEQAAIREAQEEVDVTPLRLRPVARLIFDAMFKDQREKLAVHAFACDEWQGEPSESEEMKPQWFKKSEVPYADMWQDDEFWLPQVLDGRLVEGTFVFDDKDDLTSHDVREVDHIE